LGGQGFFYSNKLYKLQAWAGFVSVTRSERKGSTADHCGYVFSAFAEDKDSRMNQIAKTQDVGHFEIF